ncbi:MAG: hypothetical protein ACI9OJ_000427 [Myxococcota bacterium]|jgi:hypothetical protein
MFLRWFAVFVALAMPQVVSAQYDRLGDDVSKPNFTLTAGALSLTLKGQLEVELHDLEGEGGPGFDSVTDTRTIGTRSPVVELDSFVFGLRFVIADVLRVNTELEFTQSSARLSGAWLEFRAQAPKSLGHQVTLGYRSPIVAIDRRTERYPLIASSFWRQPELQLAYRAAFQPQPNVALEFAVSLAMMRPLGFTAVQESTDVAGTINVLSYDPAESFSGNGASGGALIRLTLWGAFIEAFGFMGSLAAEGGTDTLRSGFPHYRDLNSGSEIAWWAGGRLGYSGHGFHLIAEAITSQEDALQRFGAYGQASYDIAILGGDWLGSIEPLVRYEVYRVLDSAIVRSTGRALRSPAVINAVSWDFDVLTFALRTAIYRDLLALRVEYYLIEEANGVPDLGIGDEPFRNDELLVHLEFRF